MKNYIYQNTLIGKKQLRQLLAWSFSNYDSMQACLLADELKYLGFKYASQAGISISIEDLRIPFVKSVMLEKANQEIHNSEKIFLKGKITDVERFQKIIDTWSLTSESLKNQIIYYFKNYDPLNSVYIMAFSGARGNLSQVRQLVGMRGLMSDPSGQIMNLPIKKNFREGLTITDYLMSGYGARKGIVDTALKTANSGYLTRRLIDVSQDILIREKDCLTTRSFLFSIKNFSKPNTVYDKILGRVLNKPVMDLSTSIRLAGQNTQITPELIQKFKEKNIQEFSIRSPLTCKLYRAICQKCYGWDLSTENLIDIGEAIGIIAGQSIGEPGTQLTMRTFHTGGIFTSEARQQIISPINGVVQFYKLLKTVMLRTNRGEDVLVTKNSGSLVLIPETRTENLVTIDVARNTILFPKNNQYISKDSVIGELINTNKQIKTEIKTVLSDRSGEIFISKLKQKINGLTNNRLIWILEGQLYNSPLHSFLNFYPDYKLNSFSYVFRTKIMNHYSGIVTFLNHRNNLYEGFLKTHNHKYSLTNSKFQKLQSSLVSKNYILTVDRFQYFITIQQKYLKTYLQLTSNEKLGTCVTNSFLTRTGGSIFYNSQNTLKNETTVLFYKPNYSYDPEIQELNRIIQQTRKKLLKNASEQLLQKLTKTESIQQKFQEFRKTSQIPSQIRKNSHHRTIIWIGEEVYKVKCDPTVFLVEEGDFISKGFEIMPDCFSKTSGIVALSQVTET
jgi:DNA-directed RNA polymerase beta'' subunit